ncbi:ABC transporter permease [Desulfospira joergensenii]|uniref:ABC transporter permease n=1 Tax=Desulfospira joergensenii TaxID=53329 RepID=UPI0003B64F57|nr:ABC transporter permease subunit [Desulfospira joergensenii]
MKHLPLFLVLTLLFVLPVVVLIISSLAPGWRFPHVWPREFNTRGLVFLVQNRDQILTGLGSSFAYSLATVLVTLILCLFPAMVFSRTRFFAKALLEGLLLTPALVPSMTFAMGLHFVFIKFSLADSFTGVVIILSMFSYPYMFRALVAGFQSLGQDFQTCARNLGAGTLETLIRVELPMLLPAMAAGGSVVFLVAFSEYFLVFLIGGGSVPSFTGTLFPLLNSSNRSLASILSLIFLFLPVLLFVMMDTALMRVYRKKGILRN